MTQDHEKRIQARCIDCETPYEIYQWRLNYARCDIETSDGSECDGRLYEIDETNDEIDGMDD